MAAGMRPSTTRIGAAAVAAALLLPSQAGAQSFTDKLNSWLGAGRRSPPAVAAALLLPSQAGAQSFTDKLNSWFGGGSSSSQPPASSTPSNAQTDIECPGVEVRAGASTLALTGPGAESTPTNTRYQVTIGQTP